MNSLTMREDEFIGGKELRMVHTLIFTFLSKNRLNVTAWEGKA